MAHIATISARDEEIGRLIAEAFDKVGKDGVITVDESQTMGTELEFTEGMQFDKGYLSPYFVTDPERWRPPLPPLHRDQPGRSLDERLVPLWSGYRRTARCSSGEDVDGGRCPPWSSTISRAPSRL